MRERQTQRIFFCFQFLQSIEIKRNTEKIKMFIRSFHNTKKKMKNLLIFTNGLKHTLKKKIIFLCLAKKKHQRHFFYFDFLTQITTTTTSTTTHMHWEINSNVFNFFFHSKRQTCQHLTKSWMHFSHPMQLNNLDLHKYTHTLTCAHAHSPSQWVRNTTINCTPLLL